jgi:hypothetical protein
MNNGFDIVNEVTYTKSLNVSIQSLKKNEKNEGKGRNSNPS